MTTPARNISKVGDFSDAIFFESVCACTSAEHGHSLMLEIDEDCCVTCTISQTLEWARYQQYDSKLERFFLYRIGQRIIDSLKYIFSGHVSISASHLFENEESLRDYANALLGAADELKQRRDNRMPDMRKSSGNTPN